MSDDFRAAMEAARAKRGYLLPHHGLFRLLSPDFAESYEAAYGRLALHPVALAAEDKEFLWLVITAVVASPTARHHVRRYREAGGTLSGIEDALRLAGFAFGRGRFDFAAESWAGHLPGWDAVAAEAAALTTLTPDVPPSRRALALLAACTCRRDGAGVERYLRAAYAADAPEVAMAEAMCLTVQPAGLPNLVHAAGLWRRLIQSGAVAASAPFQAWAAMPAEGDPTPPASPAQQPRGRSPSEG